MWIVIMWIVIGGIVCLFVAWRVYAANKSINQLFKTLGGKKTGAAKQADDNT
jgi:hypothetical protein